MRTHKGRYVCLLLGIMLLSVSCAKATQPSEADLVETGLEGHIFTFSMTANVGQVEDAVDDAMESEWTGTFTVDQMGDVHGSGSGSYNAAILNSIGLCGYEWIEEADFEFTISGTGKVQDGEIQFMLLLDVGDDINPQRTDPPYPCGDPWEYLATTADSFFHVRRTLLLQAITGDMFLVSQQIQFGQPLELQIGEVDFTVLVDLSAEPLSD